MLPAALLSMLLLSQCYYSGVGEGEDQGQGQDQGEAEAQAEGVREAEGATFRMWLKCCISHAR